MLKSLKMLIVQGQNGEHGGFIHRKWIKPMKMNEKNTGASGIWQLQDYVSIVETRVAGFYSQISTKYNEKLLNPLSKIIISFSAFRLASCVFEGWLSSKHSSSMSFWVEAQTCINVSVRYALQVEVLQPPGYKKNLDQTQQVCDITRSSPRTAYCSKWEPLAAQTKASNSMVLNEKSSSRKHN